MLRLTELYLLQVSREGVCANQVIKTLERPTLVLLVTLLVAVAGRVVHFVPTSMPHDEIGMLF